MGNYLNDKKVGKHVKLSANGKVTQKIIKLFKVNLSYNCKILLNLYFSI